LFGEEVVSWAWQVRYSCSYAITREISVWLVVFFSFFFPSGWLVGLNQCSADAGKGVSSYVIFVHNSSSLYLPPLPPLAHIFISAQLSLFPKLKNCMRLWMRQEGKGCLWLPSSLSLFRYRGEEMTNMHRGRSHWSNKIFHNEELYYLFPWCMFVNQDLSCTCCRGN